MRGVTIQKENHPSMKEKIKTLLSNVKTYWKTPMKGRYMTFREIAAYSGGGIGAYMIITLGTACILGTGNTLISSSLGVDAVDMYILYVIAVLVNIPLTGIRANIIDNTRNKAGKYRPYIVSMGIPTAVICVLMVWFPYNLLEVWLPGGEIFGESYAYVAKCAIILVLNFFLHFFYYFFYDGYENLIHILSPNSQERADVSAVKCVVYSLAPSIVNLITPIIASSVFQTNTTDIRVYRLLYPILGIFGIALCIVVYKYTSEKIIQAKTHVIKIRFTDALRAVAKNKYFWIISLAGWIGFLESAYLNIMNWIYNYGGACSGKVFGLVITIYGNASLWGMLLAPACIKRWGKKAVLVVTNLFNVVFILMMLPFTQEINSLTIWLILGCLYLNAFMGSFAHILNPAIQADIRDYQQYQTGERIDGMFSAVATIGTVITLLTSSVLPAVYEKGGITKENAARVTSNPEILSRMLGDGKTVGQILSEQLAMGQDNYNNAYSALYDTDILISLLHVLIIISAIGALMNVIPYVWYDFSERKQKSVVRVLKVRAMFEDYGNNALSDEDLTDGYELILNAREYSSASPKEANKNTYKSISKSVDNGQARKQAKAAYKEALNFNEEIEISKFVCEELDKYLKPHQQAHVTKCKEILNGGIDAIASMSMSEIKAELACAKAMPKKSRDEKEARTLAVDMVAEKKLALKTIKKLQKRNQAVDIPDFTYLEELFNSSDDADSRLKALYEQISDAKKMIKAIEAEKKVTAKQIKLEENRLADLALAVKPYTKAKTTVTQMENYTRLDDIKERYEQIKAANSNEETV